MKLVSLCLALGALSTVLHADPAPLTLTVKSYGALSSAITTIADSVQPGSGKSALASMQARIGLDKVQGLDLEKPWQIQVWLADVPGTPAFSLWIPTTDFEAFKNSSAQSALAILRRPGGPEMTHVDNYAGVFIAGSSESKVATAGHASWTSAQLGAADKTLFLGLAMSESLRQQALMGLAAGRAAVTASAGSQPPPGMDQKAMAEVMGVYFEIFEIIVKGARQLDLSIDSRADSLVQSFRVEANEGSELMDWLKPSEGTLDGVLPFAAGTAPLKVAMRMSDTPGLVQQMKKFMRISMQLQSKTPDEEAITSFEKLFDAMLPANVGAGMGFQNGLSFTGAYEFPGKDVNAVYQQLAEFMQNGMHGMTGADKPYKTVLFEPAKRTVDGVKVDLVTMEMNLDSPLYQQPGQKEMVQMMFNGGKIEFEYAIKDDKLLIAGPGQMESLLAGPSVAASPLKTNRHTVACGEINVLALVASFSAFNPAMPEEARKKLQAAKSQDTEVTFRIDLDGALQVEEVIPLKLIQAFGEMGR